MTVRTTMASLIGRLRAMLNDDTTLTDQALQDLLDARSASVGGLLIPRAPGYRTHASGYQDLEEGALLYAVPGILFPGWNGSTVQWREQAAIDVRIWWLEGSYVSITPLATPTDYTIDSSSGTVSTPAADLRGLMLTGRSYVLNAAAADGWARLAGRLATTGGEIKSLTSDGDTVLFTSAHALALSMVAYYRSLGSGGNLAI